MKKIISFDLDGTLVDGRYGNVVWNHGIPEEYAKKYSISFDDAKELIINKYRAVGDANLLWYDIEYWLKKFQLTITAQTLLDRFESYIRLCSHVPSVLEKLRGKYILVVASNAARLFVEKELASTGIAHHFTHIISATTDYLMVKKEERFYKKLCQELNILPHEIVHVGDHPDFDYETPMSLGIESYCVSSDGRLHENMIHNLKELLDRL